MRGIIVVLLCAVLFAVAGLVVGAVITQAPAPAPVLRTGDPARDLFNSSKAVNQGADVLARRQTNSMIGAGVGLVVGVLAGMGLAVMMGKKNNLRK